MRFSRTSIMTDSWRPGTAARGAMSFSETAGPTAPSPLSGGHCVNAGSGLSLCSVEKDHAVSQLPTPAPAVYVSAARSFLYRSLALGFTYPTQGVFEAIKGGGFMRDLWRRLSCIPYLEHLLPGAVDSTRRVGDDLRDLSLKGFEARYDEAFGSGGVTLEESGAALRECDPLPREIKSSYEGFGLSIQSPGGLPRPPDRLSAGLELLHFLTLKEFQAECQRDMEQTMVCLQTQELFMKAHLLRSPLCHLENRFSSEQLPVFHGELLRITAELLSGDAEWISGRLKICRAAIERKRRQSSSPIPAVESGEGDDLPFTSHAC